MTSAAPHLPDTLAAATADQPAARLTLAAALRAPSHAYLFVGPHGSGKRAAARAFAAELLTAGAEDPDSARTRALADPSPHPDLVWLEPPGTQHLVDQVRERVIAAAAYRPFEAERRVFVMAAAEAMADESQNALLKTLEEPASFAHLILLSSEPEALLETVRSRCQPIRFAALSPAALAERLRAELDGGGGAGDGAEPPGELELLAVSRLAGGDGRRARALLSPEGRELRRAAEACARAARAGELADAPWRELLAAAGAAAEAAAATAQAAFESQAAELGEGNREARRFARHAEEAAKRSRRRARNETIDLGLALLGAWLRDLAAIGEGAAELVLTADRAEGLSADAAGLDPRRARRGGELVLDTRRRLSVNVGEELALEALCFRLEFILRGDGGG